MGSVRATEGRRGLSPTVRRHGGRPGGGTVIVNEDGAVPLLREEPMG